MRKIRGGLVFSVVLAAACGLPGMSSWAVSGSENAYRIDVAPTSQDAGKAVTTTGDGQYYTEPFSGDNCDSTPIDVSVTYYTLAKAQKTSHTTLGTSDGDGNISGPVTIPADAAPTSFTGHTADVQASCDDGAYLSNVVGVTVNGTVTPTTITTTTTTTVKAQASTPTTTTTTVPPVAVAATPVVASPALTG